MADVPVRMIAVLVLLTLLSVWVCYWVARKRKADPVFWVVMAILFGPLAIPFVFLARPKNNN